MRYRELNTKRQLEWARVVRDKVNVFKDPAMASREFILKVIEAHEIGIDWEICSRNRMVALVRQVVGYSDFRDVRRLEIADSF